MQTLHCPFPSALNPGTEAAHRHTWQWAERFGLVGDANIERQVATERFTWLVGHFFPWAQRRELELISDFTSWLFWHDDVCDETALGEDPDELARRFRWLLGIFTRRNQARPHDAFDLALADLRDRFEAASPSWGWFTRVVTSIQQYFEACVWEAANRRHHRVPDVATYISMRRFAGGMYIYVDFELASRAELPLVARAQPDLQRLVQITCNVACWHNDLFSLDKELAYGDVHNLVAVIAQERRISIPEARAVAVGCCNDEVGTFASTARRLPGFGADVDGVMASYQEGLAALMRGNLDWSLGAERYRQRVAPQAQAAQAG